MPDRKLSASTMVRIKKKKSKWWAQVVFFLAFLKIGKTRQADS